MTVTRGQKFEQNGNCKHGHCTAMSKSAWCDLNNKVDLLKIHDRCPNNKYSCQKLITSSAKHFQTEGSVFKSNLQKIFRDIHAAWNEFLKPALNRASRYIGIESILVY